MDWAQQKSGFWLQEAVNFWKKKLRSVRFSYIKNWSTDLRRKSCSPCLTCLGMRICREKCVGGFINKCLEWVSWTGEKALFPSFLTSCHEILFTYSPPLFGEWIWYRRVGVATYERPMHRSNKCELCFWYLNQK